MNGIDSVSAHWTALQLLSFFGPRIGFSLLCGAIVGLERELKSKPTGLKTNMLICLGSALFTAVSIFLATALDAKASTDASRVAAQVVTGVGFIGGGAILESRGSVVGLTTAATIWVVAAIGMIVGMGNPWVGVACSVVVVAILGRMYRLQVVLTDPDGDAHSRIRGLLASSELDPQEIDAQANGELTTLKVTYKGNVTNNKEFVRRLREFSGLRDFRQV